MGLGITFVLVLLAFNANCDETLDSLVTKALNYVTNKATELSEIIKENIKILKNLEVALHSVESSLPDALVGIRFADSINTLESLYQISLRTNDEYCFMGRPLVVPYIKDQTSNYYKICVSRFSKSTTEDELKLSNLDRTLNTTTNSLRDCANNPVFRRNLQYARLCINNANNSFVTVVKSLNASPVNLVNQVDDLSKCITNTVNRGEDIIESLNVAVIDCVKKVSNNSDLIQNLPALLPNPTKTENVFKPQTSVAVSDVLKNLRISVQKALAELKVLFESAANAKNKAENNGTLVLSSVFAQTKTILAEEAAKFDSNELAKSCIANLQNLLTINNENRVAQLRTCVSSAANPSLNEVKFIETELLSYSALDKYTDLNCMANINNVFPIGGIKTCIEDKRKDDETLFIEIVLRLGELKLQAELTERRVDRCTKIASNTGSWYVARDISAFESCIQKATENPDYKFYNLPA